MDKLKEALKKLEKKAQASKRKASRELKKAENFTRAGDRMAAIQCLKRKRLYEQQINLLVNFQFPIEQETIKLEVAEAATWTVDALKTGTAAMQELRKAINTDDGDETMDETNEVTPNVKHIKKIWSTYVSAPAESDENEIEAGVEELEGAAVPQRTAEEN